MPNEMGGIADGLDVSKVRDQQNQVTEEDVKRAEDQARQAKQIQGEIKQTKDKNEKIAKFLAFLLKQIKNENIIKYVQQTFFRATDPRTNSTIIRKSINHMVAAGLFVPFFQKEAEFVGVRPMFQTFTPNQITNTQDYITYLKKLSGQYHDNIPLDKQPLLQLLLLIHQEYIGDVKENTQKEFSLGLFGGQ